MCKQSDKIEDYLMFRLISCHRLALLSLHSFSFSITPSLSYSLIVLLSKCQIAPVLRRFIRLLVDSILVEIHDKTHYVDSSYNSN